MFLNLSMLFGLSAVGIPIVIHLLNQRKFERVVWAAMRFLQISVEKNQRRMKVEDLILLILRCLLLIFVVLALSRPVLRAASAMLGPTRVTAVVILDNSYSMSQTDGVESRFELAKKAADDVIRTLPTGSSVAVILASDIAYKLIPEPTYDLTLASQQVRESPIFDRPTDLFTSVKSGMEILSGRPDPRKEIYVITDGQAVGWRRLADVRTVLEENAKEVRTHLLIVGKPEEKNLGISALRMDSGITAVNQPLRLEVRVRNFGKAEARDVNVSIAVDNDPPMDQAVIAVIPPGESRSVSLFAKAKTDGHHVVTAKIDADRLPADDWRSVAFRAVKDVKVLLIDGDPGREARESEVFFLRNALRTVPRVEWEDYFIKVSVKLATDLDGVRFEDFDAVMAANVTDFSNTVLQQLTAYVKGGGSAMFFLGENINANFYNEQLFKKYELLPAAIGQAHGDAKSQEQSFGLQDRGYEHDIVSLWRDANSGTLSSAKFFRAFDLIEEPARPATAVARPNGARVIIRFSDAKPAMMERDLGLGRVVVFASSADTAWNDLGARAGVFIPLIHRTLGFLVARQDEHLTLHAGQEFIHIAPIEFTNKDAVISKRPRHFISATKDEVRETQRIELDNGAPTLHFAGTDFAGAYDVKVGDASAARFAVQSEPEESSLDVLNEEQIKLLGESAHVVRWTPGANLTESIEKGRVGTELWFPLAVLALILATAETLLASWFSQSK